MNTGERKGRVKKELELIKCLCVPSTVLHSQCSVNHSLRSDQLSPQFGLEENQINRDIRWPDQVTNLMLVEPETEARLEFLPSGSSGWRSQKVKSASDLSRALERAERGLGTEGRKRRQRETGGKGKGYRPISTEANTFTQRASASQGRPVITTC